MMMVCGFKGTGKDTFYNNSKNNYAVYGNSSNKCLLLGPNYVRVGFADNVKKEVNDIYDLFDPNKDDIIFENTTYRDLLIAHAKNKKKEDINYWVKKSYDWKKRNNVMITDFRFLHEYDYLVKLGHEPVTIRLFRSEVTVPTDISERSLDNFLTDFLVVPLLNHDNIIIIYNINYWTLFG